MTNILYLWHKCIKKFRLSAIKNSQIEKSAKIESGSSFVNSKIGRHSFCGYDCDIYNTEIGNFCSIANNVIIGGGHHPMTWVGTSPVFYEGRDSVKKKFSSFPRENHLKTKIGSDVWIGARAIIIQGVKVGDGAVIGAGSVVTKDVPPFSVMGGVPAKFIKFRFTENIIESLLQSKWWDCSDLTIERCAHLIQHPQLFLNELKKCG